MNLWWWFRQHFSHVISNNCRVVYVSTAFYRVSFIFVENGVQLRPLSYCKQPSLDGRYTLLNWARSFQNAFYKCSMALNIFCFLKYCIFDECRHFSSCRATLTKGWVLPRKGISWRGTIPPRTDILGSWWRRWWPFSVICHCIDFRRGEFSSVPRWW